MLPIDRVLAAGVVVVWDKTGFETPVIPAKAGIQFVDSVFPKVREVASRFRGNDCDFERPCFANDTNARGRYGDFPVERTIYLTAFARNMADCRLTVFNRQSAIANRQSLQGHGVATAHVKQLPGEPARLL